MSDSDTEHVHATESDPPHPSDPAVAAAGPESVHPSARIADDDTDEQITEKLKRQGVRLGKGSVTPAVFWPSLILIAAVAFFGIFMPDATDNVLGSIQTWIVETLGWYYMVAIAIFIVVALIFCFSRFGNIRLGSDDEKPEFGLISWFCMLFAAGMGVGLVFYGVGEPVIYSTTDPKPGWPGTETVDGETTVLPGQQSQVALLAMAQTFVHWGLHPWAVYAVIGLSVAYAIHRRGRPVSIRWALEPIFGDRVKGALGDVIDTLAVLGTFFGIATSLGLGAQQIATGMQAIGIVDTVDNTVLVVLIIVITLLATVSVISGLGRGIKWLSNINLSLAGVLLISVLLLGPTLFLFQNFAQSLGAYLANVLNMTFDIGAYTGEAGSTWNSTWTLFYWGWWVSWAPFVGVFIARISRGRTVRQFVAGVLLVPSLVGMIWFSVMGGAGLFRQFFSDDPLVGEDGEFSAEAGLFDVLGNLPLGAILSVIALFVIAIFFITSSDSGSLVVDMLASGGHPNPPTWSRVMFALLEGALAIGLMLAGGLGAVQAGSLATALPFSVILLLMCVATFKGLKTDQARLDDIERRNRYRWVSEQLSEDFDDAFGEKVDNRIDYRIQRTTGIFDRGREGRHAASEDGSVAVDTEQRRPPFGRRRKE